MGGGTRTANNPRRVPPILEAIDGPQEGRFRTISPVGGAPLRVGAEAARQERGMDPNDEFVTVETTETRLSADGKDSLDFVAGSRVHRSVAARFGLGEATPFRGARPEDEVPDLAPTELEARGLPAAPENRMEPPPANRRKPAEKGE